MNSIEKTEICIRWTMCNTREQVGEAGEESSKAARGKPKVKSDNVRKDSRSSPGAKFCDVLCTGTPEG
ncbi:hypothetical protein H320_22210 [Vibrio parahaemolyticus 49]|nr:hypothetical protein [Vibrio parahaemolyticus]KIT39854.1 hypothetical protein H320_22210 [Vibrio parahaemolyticus 49]KOE90778.1 hypothetical protein ACS84_04505 [Vibrio parahaemolyticus]TOE66064.1 hypothetical protein CGJ39_05330 [Vibrio parahaemolyticus]TOK28613.1 hypothetical protein CGI22_02780 [Vibrio parahaemolyticus]